MAQDGTAISQDLSNSITVAPILHQPPQYNFPPFYHCICCCCCQPCYYQDINREIVVARHRDVVRFAFRCWLSLLGYYPLALLATIILWGQTLRDESGFLFATTFYKCFICMPLLYVIWFRPLYHAFRDKTRRHFRAFFTVNIFTMIALFLDSVGMPGISPGFYNATHSRSEDAVTIPIATQFFMILSGIYSLILMLLLTIIHFRVYHLYKALSVELDHRDAIERQKHNQLSEIMIHEQTRVYPDAMI